MRFFASKRIILVLLGLIWLELTVLPVFSVRAVKPNLFFIFLVYYAFRVGYHSLVPLALFFGLAKDIFANSFFGLETASYVTSAALMQYVVMRLDRDKGWIQWISLFVFSWVSLMIFSLLALLVQKEYGFNLHVASQAFLAAVYTTVLGFILFPVFDRWTKLNWQSKQYELFR